MAKCELCGKTSRSGNNVSHSKRRTKRLWVPNIQHATLLISGVRRQVSACTRCLRTQGKVALKA
ncbi:MAG: 50S ribosomal protein L28 [Chloroflexota bacterium]|nr:50S ribosomal protein L28 [Chloroflexota bacterium]